MFRIYNIYGDQLVFEDVSDTLENFSDDDYLLLISNGMPSFIRTSKLNIAVNTFEVATPTLSQNLTTNEISLSCETPNSIIYYSTDGSNPFDPNTRHEYNSPFVIDKPITIKAIATVNEVRSSVLEANLINTFPPQFWIETSEGGLIEALYVKYIINNIENPNGNSKRLWWEVYSESSRDYSQTVQCQSLLDKGAQTTVEFSRNFQAGGETLSKTTSTMYQINDDGSRYLEFYYDHSGSGGTITLQSVNYPQLLPPTINGNIIKPDTTWNEIPDKIMVDINGSIKSFDHFPIEMLSTGNIKAWSVKEGYRDSEKLEVNL